MAQESHKKIPPDGGAKAIRDAFKTLVFLLRIGVFLLIIAFLYSGMVNLNKNESAIVFRFGAERTNVLKKEGYSFGFPYPIDEVITVSTGELKQLTSDTFWYSEDLNTNANALVPGIDGYLVTADRNIIHASYTLKYLISDAREYIFAGESEEKSLRYIRLIADNTLLKLISGTEMKKALKGNEINEVFRNRLQQQVEKASLGITVESITISGLEVSPLLKEKLENLNAANLEQEQLSSKARIYSTKISGEAQSGKDRLLSSVETTIKEKVEKARRSAIHVRKLLSQHQGDIKAAKNALLRQAMPDILISAEELFLMNEHESRELELKLQRRPNEKIERELEAEEAKRRKENQEDK